MTHELIALGHPVVAVDSDPRMLDRIRGAELVCARIEELDLGRRFPVVLLGSHLVNRPEPGALLDSCRRHAGGVVLIERHPPSWFADPAGVRDVTRPGPGLLAATVDHTIGATTWTEDFVVRDHDLPVLLEEHGLAVERYLTEDERWVLSVPRQRCPGCRRTARRCPA
ncbi:class I SAM-dependent methyltransferase [Lentzea tibetensis]|uniref:class I SAM-dependent methyltransferase n=1 Tax=Lentzea tibetensis TaxID=2591470 RepID=UPI001644F537|nr:class I SAM-dependent methyltransferase [Lentzea tibetensis]